jgi:hypothetical protein
MRLESLDIDPVAHSILTTWIESLRKPTQDVRIGPASGGSMLATERDWQI